MAILAASAGGLGGQSDRPALSDRAQRAAVALFLYGETDPDEVAAAGLQGLGSAPVRIELAKVGDCRFTVAAADRRETIDFRRIADIRHTVIADPAAGLVRSVEADGGPRPPQIAIAVLTGAEDAVCDARQCGSRCIFALGAVARLDEARAAAASFQRLACPRYDAEGSQAR